jgi:hypothetical protein
MMMVDANSSANVTWTAKNDEDNDAKQEKEEVVRKHTMKTRTSQSYDGIDKRAARIRQNEMEQ